MSGAGPALWQCDCGSAACGCCAGVAAATPLAIANRPGLARIGARIGTHPDFLGAMQARLSAIRIGSARPLAALRTRDPADPTIALIDAFATVCEVLTFYQERIANEGYLRTATEDRSVRELARLIGYEPSPAVAASTFLAFELDSEPDVAVTIPAGTGAQSTPGQDELPQVFETMSDLPARARWNRLGVRLTEPEDGSGGQIYLAGTDTGLIPGDALLFQHGAAEPLPMRVIEVRPDPAARHTAVAVLPWEKDVLPPPGPPPGPSPAPPPAAAPLASLGAAAPGGKTAADIAPLVEALEQSPPDAVNAAAQMLADAVSAGRARIGGLPQPALRAWLDDVDNAAAAAVAASSSALAAAPLPSWVAGLAVRPSHPPASVEGMRRSTAASFSPGSEASYRMLGAALPAIEANLAAALAGDRCAAPEAGFTVYALRLRAGLFGRTFPKQTRIESDRNASGQVPGTRSTEIGEWPIRAESGDRENESIVTLDAAYQGIAVGSWVLIDMRSVDAVEDEWYVDRVGEIVVAQLSRVESKLARADYGGSGETTALILAGPKTWLRFSDDDDDARDDQGIIDRDFQLIRRTSVYAQAEELALAGRPITTHFCHEYPEEQAIELDGLYADLEPGRHVVVSGERADISCVDFRGDKVRVEGVQASEVAMIAEVTHAVRAADQRPRPAGSRDLPLPGDRMHSFIRFANPLSYCYDRASVIIRANLVKATHGETQREVLGNGDAAGPRQAFTLKRAPLTFLPAPTASGAANTLQVFVDDIRWRQMPHLLDTGPAERVYSVRTAADGSAEVIFPDGHDGARPPTGTQNIRSVYRAGGGRAGNMGAARLEQLVARPLGLRGVSNPVPATGGADAEDAAQTRRNAPITTMALDRLVSLVDHENFARSFAGIAKADARLLSDGRRRLVYLTVAAEDDAPIDPGGELLLNLRRAIRNLGDPDRPFRIVPRELRLLIVSAGIRIDADREWEPVARAVRAALADRFGFDARELGEGLAASRIVAAIQSVPGVAWVDLDTLGGIDTMTGPDAARVPRSADEMGEAVAQVAAAGVLQWVPAQPADAASGDPFPAGLLLLSPDIPATLVLNQLV